MSSITLALIVGLLQGIIEWLPISSQGNLVILMISLLGLKPEDALDLTIYLHLGTGLAALTYFRDDIFEILQLNSDDSKRLLLFLLVTTVITGFVGLPLFMLIRTTSLFGGVLIGITCIALIFTGILERSARNREKHNTETLGLKEGMLFGVIQGFSALPGVSRSGVTTSVFLLKGYSGEDAFRISFIMSIPAVFAAVVGLTFIQGAPKPELSLLVALTTSFISALLSIDFLLKVARKLQFWRLCIVMGILGILSLIPYFL